MLWSQQGRVALVVNYSVWRIVYADMPYEIILSKGIQDCHLQNDKNTHLLLLPPPKKNTHSFIGTSNSTTSVTLQSEWMPLVPLMLVSASLVHRNP